MKTPRRELQDTAEELSQYLEIEGKTGERANSNAKENFWRNKTKT